jgi:hypothetical protein
MQRGDREDGRGNPAVFSCPSAVLDWLKDQERQEPGHGKAA